jgi:hypothetical protein
MLPGLVAAARLIRRDVPNAQFVYVPTGNGAPASSVVETRPAMLVRAPQHATRLGRILRFTPDAGARDAHRAEAHAIHHQIPADGERARRRRR